MRARWVALGVLTLAVLLIAIDATVLVLAIPFLAEDLRPSSIELLWIGDVYSFAIAGLLVTMGTLSDRIGRKRLLMIGSAAFGAMSVAAAYAPNPPLLVVARALLGMAGATLMPSSLSLIRNIFTDPKERTTAIGVWGAAASAGAAIGPLVGGALLEHFWWGSVFLINLPVMALVIGVGIWALPESRDPNPGPWDPLSVVMSMVGLIGVIYAVKELAGGSGVRPDFVVAAVAGVTALTVFVRRQLRLPVPLIDVRLFRDPPFAAAVTAALLAMLGLSGVLFFVSQYFQLVLGFSPLAAGAAELPTTAGSMAAGLLAGVLVGRFGGRPVLTAGLALTCVGLGCFMFLHADTPYVLPGAALLVLGLGAGAAFTVATDMVLASAPPEKAGAASAVSETAYELGTALGIALLGSLLTFVYRSELPQRVPRGVRESLAEASGASPGLQAIARQAFVDGMRTSAAIAAALLALAAVATWFMLRRTRSEAPPAPG
ncbi:MFS transporter [Bailinhaonella thermotolerans]|uniref:MFS transporter n=1 Tax=Bailinhaonella thermotolerans TaxID=1070861 RepID=A0A3A4BJH8_9ACTN|nr:MFS transporter [Bailinhaonella thermotolerans]RJL35404.1 MFS transporter [Bailinhaonella thermotolerans]